MAIDKEERERLRDEDPAVAAHFGHQIEMPVIPEIDFKEKARKRALDDKRKERRTSWDFDPEIKAIVAELAEKIGTSQSQVAGYLILAGLQAIKQGIMPHVEEVETEPSRSLRFELDLKMPPIPK